ncbi:hypothetical protein GBS0709_01740 [Edwardsiella tarda]|nr:hypothetical protein GBS0709_01740 [Edwardsiella tarda]GAC64735.1 hypothetical protein ET1_13_00180 [Edwardsiella tarda ATCC 15947 = NBRC 105688]
MKTSSRRDLLRGGVLGRSLNCDPCHACYAEDGTPRRNERVFMTYKWDVLVAIEALIAWTRRKM